MKVKLEAEPTEKEIEEQALDDEFAAMSFEELLAQEKGRGGNVRWPAPPAVRRGRGDGILERGGAAYVVCTVELYYE